MTLKNIINCLIIFIQVLFINFMFYYFRNNFEFIDLDNDFDFINY